MSPGDASGLAWVLGVGGGLASIVVTAWCVYVIVDGFRRRQQLRAATELQGRLLDRIGSAREFAEFLATDAGARFLDAIAVDRRVAHIGILRTLQSGIVALILGVALFLPSHRILGSTGAAALGTVAAALGVGLLVASAVSYVAAKSMGLLTTTTRADDRTSKQ
jgi:hypothetical protein